MKKSLLNFEKLNKLFLLVCLFCVGTISAQVTTLENWTNLYHGTSNSQTISYSIPTGTDTNRLLLVAVATSRSDNDSRTVSITYGGRSLTLASGNLNQTGYRQHTAIYYLREADIDNATNSNLIFTVSGGTTRINTVWAAVFDYVNQTTTFQHSNSGQSNGTATDGTTLSFSSNLTIQTNNQAVYVVTANRYGNTTPRTISSYPSNFTMVDEQTSGNTDGIRSGVANRSIPTSNTNSNGSVTLNNNARISMTGVSIIGITCPAPTANAGSALSPICQGGTSAALGGSVGGSATGGTWTSNAGGTFSPNETTLNATWTPPANYSGTATLTLTTNGGCGSATASKNLVVSPPPSPITVDFSVATSVCPGTSLTATTTVESVSLLSQNFNSANNWTTTNSSSGGSNPSRNNTAWTLRANNYSTSGETFNSNDSTQFYLSNSNGHSGTTSTMLQSPAFSTVGLGNASFSFFHYYRHGTGGNPGSASVEVSTNGSSWTNLTTYSSTQGARNGFVQETISLASYLNQATVYVRFNYNASQDFYWAIDNVSVTGSLPTPTFSWSSSPAGFSSSLQNPTIVAPVGTTTYTVTATNAAGCSVSASKVLIINPMPTDLVANVSAGTVCAGTSVDLTSSATSNSPSNGSITVLSENFNETPVGWTTENTTTGGTPANAAWTLRPNNYNSGTQYGVTISSNDSTQFYLSDSDTPGSGSSTKTILTSPAFSTSGLSSASLNFYHYYRHISGGSGVVEVSLNGTSWTTLATYNSDQLGPTNFSSVAIPLDSYLNQPTVYIRFNYTASWGYYWAIDNVSITGVSTLPAVAFAWTSTPAGFTSTQQNPENVVPSVNTVYTVTVTNGYGCSASASTAQVVVGPTTTWNGPVNGWTNGAPTSSTAVIFNADYVVNADFEACSVTVNSGANVVVNSTKVITVDNALKVNNGGAFSLQNNAVLLQNGTENLNEGAITVNRNSSAILRQDYTLWSSPVAGQGLYDFSKTTLPNRFYVYNTLNDQYSNAVGFNLTNLQYPSPLVSPNGINGTDTNNVPFATAKGYLIRTPWNHPTAPAVFAGQFKGVANSGDLTYVMNLTGSRFNLVGNPYPSPIDMEKFVEDNQNNITTSLYFWRETNGNQDNNAYCQWNDGLFQSNNESQVVNPNGIIRTGQGFFVQATGAGTALVFNNNQRRSDVSNQFFRQGMTQDVYWLNLTNTSGLFSQTVVSYKEYATNSVDRYDGKNIGAATMSLASTIDGVEFGIQGKASFVDTDIVPLSFKVATAGNYTIAIDHTIGLFNGSQTIYLKDKMLQTIHNLTAGAYVFTTESGTFADRFEIVYRESALGVDNPNFTANQVVIYKDENNQIVVNTGTITMNTIRVFDVRGRLLTTKNNINASQTSLQVDAATQVLLVQVTSVDGEVVTKKVIR